MKRILKVLILIIILILLFNTNAQVYGLSDIIEDGKDFIQEGNKDKKLNIAELQGLSGYLYNILLTLGVIIAVIVATILGIQFMISGAEGQAKVKEMILPFVVGCIIVFGGFGFWKIAITVGEKLEGSGTSTSDTFAECAHAQGGVTIIGSSYVCRDCGTTIQWNNGDILCDKCGKRLCPNCGRLLE